MLGNCLPAKSRSVSPALATMGGEALETLISISPGWYHSSNVVWQHHDSANQKNKFWAITLHLQPYELARQKGRRKQNAGSIDIVRARQARNEDSGPSGRPWGPPRDLDCSTSARRKFPEISCTWWPKGENSRLADREIEFEIEF